MDIFIILTTVGSLYLLFVNPYFSNLQAATMWIGKKIASPDTESFLPNGFQDAITPSFQNKANIIQFVAIAVILISGSFIKWYVGVGILILVMIIGGILGKILYPNTVNHYAKIIFANATRRKADYVRDNDAERTDAIQDVLNKLESLLLELENKKIKIPSMTDMKKYKNGFDI